MVIEFTDGQPGFGPCASCGSTDELRMGHCFDCAMRGEERAAHRAVAQHLGHGLWRALRGRFDFATKTDFVWAWERLTKTGDYAPGGEFDSAYFNPRPAGPPLRGPSPPPAENGPSDMAAAGGLPPLSAHDDPLNPIPSDQGNSSSSVQIEPPIGLADKAEGSS